MNLRHIAIIAHRRVERDRLTGHPEQRLDTWNRQVKLVGKILGRRLAAQFLAELFLRSPKLRNNLDHVDRDPNRAGLV